MKTYEASVYLLGLLVIVGVLFPGSRTLAAASTASRDVLNYGDTISGSLLVAGQVDEHTFVAEAGDVVIIRLAEVTSALEPHVRLVGPGGQVGDDSDYTLAEIVTAPLAYPGVYTISVWDNGNDETGDYYLHLQDIHDPAGATALSFGSTLTGTVTYRAQTIAYTLSGEASDRVLLRLAEAAGSGGYYPQLRVYAHDGTLLAQQANSYVSQINTVELPATADYTVLVLDYQGTNTGDFLLHAQRTNNPASATSIAYGQTLAGSISQRAQTVAYTLSATTADVLLARLTETTSDAEPLLRLYDPDGVQIAVDSDYTTAEFLVTEMPVTGTYTLLVMDDPGLDVYDFYLHLQDIHDPAGATALSFGSTLSGTVTYRAQTIAYTLSGNAADRVLLRLAEAAGSGNYYPFLRVYARDGTLLAQQANAYVSEINTVELPATADYTVLVLDYQGTNTGDFLLHAQRTNNPGGALPISYGGSLSGSLVLRAECDAYTFTGTINDTVRVTMPEITTDLEPLLRLYDPDGIQIAADTDYTEAVISGVTLTVDGTYTVLAMDSPGLDTGDYGLEIDGGPSTVPVPDVPVIGLQLHACTPNPFNPATTIRFDLPHPENVKLTVHAVNGRLVATLLEGRREAGTYEIVWRGCDDSGRRVASGAYLVRFQAGDRQLVRRATLVK